MSLPSAIRLAILAGVLTIVNSKQDSEFSLAKVNDIGETIRKLDNIRAPYRPTLQQMAEERRVNDDQLIASDGNDDIISSAREIGNDRLSAAVSPACIEAVERTFRIENLETSYPAQQMVDAFGKPGSAVLRGETKWWGSYKECQSVKEAQYCLLSGNLYIRPQAFLPPLPQLPFELGLCMPRVCSETDINNIVIDEGLNGSSALKPILAQFVQITNTTVFCAKKEAFTPGSVAALAICCVFAVLVLAGTVVDYFSTLFDRLFSRLPGVLPFAKPVHEVSSQMVNSQQQNIGQWQGGREHSEKTPLVNKQFSGEQRSEEKPSVLVKFFLCFSILRNTRRLLDTSEAPGTITCLHGMRVLSISWVALGHTYYLMPYVLGNSIVVLELEKRFTFQTIVNALFSVDTFFFIGGVLVMYLSIKQMDANNGKLPLGKFYFHRFWRLTPSYMFLIMFYSTLLNFFGEGPVWSQTTTDNNCKNYWWTNLLYINNFYPSDPEKSCVGWGWYLACDMQFYVVSPIIIIALYKWRIRGMAVIGAFLSASFFTIFIITDYYNVRLGDVILMGRYPKESNVDDYQNKTYYKPYTRCAPYLVGLALGYMLRRKQEFTTGGMQRVGKLCLVLIGWCVSAILLLSTLYGFYDSAHSGKLLGKAATIMYAVFARFAWSVGLAWIVFACHHGYGSVINQILSAKFWIPLSRLSYNVYLVHILALEMYFLNLLQPFYYTDISISFVFLGCVFASFLAAYLLTVFVEMPFFEMEKLFFKSRRRG